MKFSKLTKKLLLSALSLGLAVVTLTTTTYAWYTSSTTADAKGNATTSAETTESTLLISTNGSTWGKSVSLSSGVELVPLQWNATSKSFTVYNSSTAVETGFYKFDLYFKTTKTINSEQDNVNVFIKSLSIANKAESLTSIDNLLSGVAADNSDGLPSADKYAVDAVDALDLVIKNGETYTAYNLDEEVVGKNAVGFDEDETPNAANYYNGVMETNLTGSDPATLTMLDLDAAGGVSIAELTATDTSVMVTFYIYLNGWDNYCFDACKNQGFDVILDFSTSPNTAS